MGRVSRPPRPDPARGVFPAFARVREARGCQMPDPNPLRELSFSKPLPDAKLTALEPRRGGAVYRTGPAGGPRGVREEAGPRHLRERPIGRGRSYTHGPDLRPRGPSGPPSDTVRHLCQQARDVIAGPSVRRSPPSNFCDRWPISRHIGPLWFFPKATLEVGPLEAPTCV